MTASDLHTGDVLLRAGRTYTVTHLRRELAGVWADLDIGGLGVPLYFAWDQPVSLHRHAAGG